MPRHSHIDVDIDSSIATEEDNLEWHLASTTYGKLIKDKSKDSAYLRKHGLQSTLLKIIGDANNSRLLDIGCGDGWLVSEVVPKEAFECDVIRHHDHPVDRNYQNANIQKALPYEDQYFDVTVASLVLIWLDTIDSAVREMYRVTKKGGRVVISLMHPYFYRTGDVNIDGSFVIKNDLSKQFSIIEHKIGGEVGPLTYYFRPLNDYLNELIHTGFQIKHVEDWFIDMEHYNGYFDTDKPSKYRRTGKVPMYTFIECTR